MINIYKVILLLLLSSTFFTLPFAKRVCVFVSSTLKQQKMCQNIINRAKNADFIKTKTKLFPPNRYHMSLIYVTMPENTSASDEIALALMIKNICYNSLPPEGLEFTPTKLAYWGRIYALVFSCKNFSTYHTKISKKIKNEMSSVAIEHEESHQPHVSLGVVKTKKGAEWPQGDNELKIIAEECYVIEKESPLLVVSK